MGILSNIKDKLFGKKAAKETAAPSTQLVAEAVIEETNAVVDAVPEPVEPVDIEAILEAAVQAKGVKLNWRSSIVDFMKALDLDSSLDARKKLAADLNYKGTAADGSAEKNIWLHKELMKTLAENGGKVPQDLLD